MPSVTKRQFVTTAGALPAGIWGGTIEANGQTEVKMGGRQGRRDGQNGDDSGGEPDPASAAALFNTGYSHEAEVAVGDRQYVIYRYENYLAEDAGLEVFQAEKRMTSADRVDSVFTAEGWQRAFKTLERERLKAAADVGETAVSFNDPLRTISEALGVVLDLIRQIQSELGRDLWRVVTDRYPQIEEFRDLARETKTTADGWVDASTRLVESLPKVRQGNDRLASAAARDFRGLTPAFYNRFETHVGSVSSTLGTLASIAQELVDPFQILGGLRLRNSLSATHFPNAWRNERANLVSRVAEGPLSERV